MQDNTSKPFDIDKRKMHTEQYDVIPPDGGMWNQLHEQVRTRSQ